MVPVTYATDRKRAEALLLAAAEGATAQLQQTAGPFRDAMNEQYHLDLEGLEPRVFYRITDNWLELNLRFLVADNASRSIRDQIARDILDAFDAAGIGIASTTVDIVAFPPLRRA